MENTSSSAKRSPNNKPPSLLARIIGYDKGTTFLPPFSLGGWIFFLAGVIPALIIGWIVFPALLYSEQPQPIEFNHALHLNPDKVFGIEGETRTEKCLFCHRFREDGTFAGIPKLEACTMCHSDPGFPMGESKAEKKFLEEYVAKQKEVPWHSYYSQPDCVYFSHIAHVKMGEVDCSVCHGNHGQTKKLPPYQVNRLTGYSINIWGRNIAGYKTDTSDRMKMDDCAECHSRKGHEENNACFVCHK